MPNGVCYLPEYHDFEHIAQVPWPRICTDYQQDWVNAITTLELWLNSRCGQHYKNWAYSTHQDHNYWEACVAFRWAKHKTLFLLTWA